VPLELRAALSPAGRPREGLFVDRDRRAGEGTRDVGAGDDHAGKIRLEGDGPAARWKAGGGIAAAGGERDRRQHRRSPRAFFLVYPSTARRARPYHGDL